MPTKDVAAKVKEIVCHQLLVDEEDVSNTEDLASEQGMDSYDLVELVMSLEEHFDITISDEEGEKVKTVDDAVKLVTKKKEVCQ
jgi:acyl carrier protein